MKKNLILICLIFFGCEKEITLDMPQVENKIVVEGSIEPNFPPYVILTKSEGYFEPINSETYDNLFVKDATVLVWTYNEDGTKDSVTLTQLPPPFDSIPIYTDSNVFYNPGTEFLGEPGKTYFLKIKWGNKVITSETTIPEPTPLDCLWVEKNENTNKDYKYDIRAIYSDPVNIQNHILIRSKRKEHWVRDSINCSSLINNADPRLILVDAGSDILVNGESFETFFPKPKDDGTGFPSGSYNAKHTKYYINSDGLQDSLEFPNDIVLIKFCQIDEASLKFWRGVARASTNTNNPFAEPLNLVSNIKNGLGIWSGYAASYYEVPIIKNTVIKKEYSELTIWDIF